MCTQFLKFQLINKLCKYDGQVLYITFIDTYSHKIIIQSAMIYDISDGPSKLSLTHTVSVAFCVNDKLEDF